MHFSALAAALVFVCVILAIIVSVLLPFALIGGLIWALVRTLDALRARRVVGVGLDPQDAVDRDIGWAVGLLVAGILWCLGRWHFAALLLGAGAAILTRGLLGMRREARAPRS
jgi:hypothetical protein